MARKTRKRRTNVERSAEMRRKLLDATEACLIELGYANTSNLAVCRRAGASNGALLHHFHTRENLMASMLERLYDRLKQQVIREIEGLKSDSGRMDRLVDMLWSIFDSEEFKAVLELWLAAANDMALRSRVFPVMKEFSDSIEPTAARLLPDMMVDASRFSGIVGLLMYMVQGMGLARSIFGPRDADESLQMRSLMKEMIRCAFEGDVRAEGHKRPGKV